MFLQTSLSSLLRRVRVLRWILPLVLSSIVVGYEILRYVVFRPSMMPMSFVWEVSFFGVLGPAMVAVTLAWIHQQLVARQETEGEMRRLNATLEEQIAERTRSLEQACRELEQKNQGLQDLDQLKSEFVSMVSHELRAPLTNINGGIELLMVSPHLTPQCRETLTVIHEQSQRLTRMVETILDVSVIEAGHWPLSLGAVALPPLIKTTVEQVRPRAGQREFLWTANGDLPFAWADEDSLVQVLGNLLENAIRYSPEGSTVRIEVEARDNSVELSVSDEGCGIPADYREMVFEKFFKLYGQDHQREYGYGLGLYVARRLVEAQEGRIWIDADCPKPGTRFVISLPRAPEEEP